MSVREYIGARYVPLFADPIEWNNTKTYEPLTIVYYQGNSYTSRQAVPTGIAITNTEYWALTGNYNAQIEAYRAEVQEFADDISDLNDDMTAIKSNGWVTTARIADDAVETAKIDDGAVTTSKLANSSVTPEKISASGKTYINVLSLGIANDGVTDNFSTLQTVLNNLSDNGGGCLYFPAGQYNISNTLVIDDNISIIGDGKSTILYGSTNAFKMFGTVLLIVGNNVTIENIFGSHVENNSNFNEDGNNFGFIGISSYTRASAIAYVQDNTQTLIQRNTHDILINNLFSDSHYVIQTEGVNVYNVTYSNIIAPNSCVSFQANPNYNCGRFIANNIICAYFRAKSTAAAGISSFGANISNIFCNAIYIYMPNANVDNVYSNYYSNCKVAQWISAGTFTSDFINGFNNCNVSNVVINTNEISINKKLLVVAAGIADVNITNVKFVKCTSSANTNVHFAEISPFVINASNIDFTNVNDTHPPILSGNFVNCEFNSVEPTTSVIRSNEWPRNLTALVPANTSVLSNVATFGNFYSNYFYRLRSSVKFFYAIQFTEKTSVSSTPNMKIASFSHEMVKPKTTQYAVGYVLSSNNWLPSMFRIDNDGIHLVYLPATSFSRVMITGEYILS